MKLKNISPVERHVEKIVLVVAAAAAVYLGYVTFRYPLTVIDEKGGRAEVRPGEVENVVETAVNHLRRVREDANHAKYPPLQPYSPYIHNDDKGLPASLLADVAKFGPDEAPINGIGNPGQPRQPIAIPSIPAPTNVALEQFRGVVILNPPAPGVRNANWQPKTQDMSWIRITASYNMAALWENITGANVPPDQRPIPVEAQRLTIVRVETEKRVKNADGAFGPWQALDPIPGQVGPTADQPFWDIDLTKLPEDPKILRDYVNKIDLHLNDIIHPSFLPVQSGGQGSSLAGGVGLAVPEPAPEPQPRTPVALVASGTAAKMSGAVSRDVRPGGAAGGVAARPPIGPLPPVPAPSPYAGGAAGGALVPPPAQNVNIAEMVKNPAVQLIAYDPTVQADSEVQYRMRLKIYNPLYKFPANVPLVKAAARKEPYLCSAWVECPADNGTVHTLANQFFWLTMGVGGGIDVKIFKWAGGRWVATEDTITPGAPVGQPRTPPGLPKGVDFSTPYLVVDVLPDRPVANDATVVLLNTASGQVVTRTLSADTNDPQRQELERMLHPALAPVPAAPGGAPALP